MSEKQEELKKQIEQGIKEMSDGDPETDKYWRECGLLIQRIVFCLSDSDFAGGRIDYDDEVCQVLDEAKAEIYEKMSNAGLLDDNPERKNIRDPTDKELVDAIKKWFGTP
jgi:hypothetical protein